MKWRPETPEETYLKQFNAAEERRLAEQRRLREKQQAAELRRAAVHDLAETRKGRSSGSSRQTPIDRQAGSTSCELCHRSPAVPIRLRSTGGYVVYRTLRSSREIALCKECGLEALHHSQKVAAVGIATINFFAPYALAQNQKWITRLKRLPDPK